MPTIKHKIKSRDDMTVSITIKSKTEDSEAFMKHAAEIKALLVAYNKATQSVMTIKSNDILITGDVIKGEFGTKERAFFDLTNNIKLNPEVTDSQPLLAVLARAAK